MTRQPDRRRLERRARRPRRREDRLRECLWRAQAAVLVVLLVWMATSFSHRQGEQEAAMAALAAEVDHQAVVHLEALDVLCAVARQTLPQQAWVKCERRRDAFHTGFSASQEAAYEQRNPPEENP